MLWEWRRSGTVLTEHLLGCGIFSSDYYPITGAFESGSKDLIFPDVSFVRTVRQGKSLAGLGRQGTP